MLKGATGTSENDEKNVNMECKQDTRIQTFFSCHNDSVLASSLFMQVSSHISCYKRRDFILAAVVKSIFLIPWHVRVKAAFTSIWRNNRLPNPLEEFRQSHIY